MVPDVLRSLAKDTSALLQCENNAAHKHKTSGPPFKNAMQQNWMKARNSVFITFDKAAQ